MKLQHKINIRFILITSIVFIASGLLFYFVLDKVINKNIEGMLKSRKEFVNFYLKTHVIPDSGFISPDQSLYIKPTLIEKRRRWFSDTLVYDEDEKELILCRRINLITQANHKNYEVTIIQSLVEAEDLTGVIITFMVILFIIILFSIFFLNQWQSKSVWKPFFNSLEQLKSFEIGQKGEIHFSSSNIYEFDKLNHFLNQLIQKVQTDFINLKEFTENASHEIQTPLSIIKSKLELVLHDTTISDVHRNRINTAYESVNRLSKLNEALLLLSKIENRQFTEHTEINLCELIRSRVENIDELLKLKNINIKINFQSPLNISIHPVLADILINNLLNNAIKHNVESGKIEISSVNSEIIFSNTGEPLKINSSKLFQRFAKQGSNKESTGLGLAIAYEICKNYNLNLTYFYENDRHKMVISTK